MITKKQFCEQILRDSADELGIKVEEINDGYIYQSSTLAVAMEYLGLLESKSAKEYTQTRGGIFFTSVDYDNKDINTLSVREFINLLPETLV